MKTSICCVSTQIPCLRKINVIIKSIIWDQMGCFQQAQDPKFKVYFLILDDFIRSTYWIQARVLDLKGYLHYKTIISQNMSSEAQAKNFLFCRKVMFHSQDIQVFVFLTIP